MVDPAETEVSGARAEPEARELLEAVRSLAAQVGSLQADLHALRSSDAPLPAGPSDVHGWDERPPAAQQSPPWVRSIATPEEHRRHVPRLALEIAFLAAVAIVAALARLDALAIVLVMAAAWSLVAVVEWAAAREAAKQETALLRSGLASAVAREDAAWFGPPVSIRTGAGSVSEDTAARLPPPPQE